MTIRSSLSTAPRGPRARRRTALVAAVAAAGLLLTACGGDSGDSGDSGSMDGMDHGGSRPSTGSASAPAGGKNPAPGAFNDADVMFAQMMIPHHEQALEMSALADGRARDAEIKKLSARIAGAQKPEIEKMRSWLAAWGKPESAGGGMDHGSESGSESESGSDAESGSGMSGMMTAQDMAGLKASQGKDFDRKFAQLMIDHHRGAVEMAEDERKNGRNATARKLADEVVAGQSTEIDELTAILGRL
ncbi:DUF305 domain-containing protein [Streptomyces sp. NPDC001889]